MLEPDIVGIGDGAVHLERGEVFAVEPLFDILGPVPAQAARLETHIDLGVMDERRIGDLIALGKLMGVVIGDLRGAAGLDGVDAGPHGEDGLFKTRLVLRRAGGRAVGMRGTGGEQRQGQ